MDALEPRFELFDHTADVGVRVRAPTLAGLVAPAVEGLYAVIGDVAATDHPQPWSLTLEQDEMALIFRDFLGEVLYLFDQARRRVTNLRVTEFSPRRLAVSGETRPVDDRRSTFEREVKAVTYHELAVREVPGGYEATFIVDI